MTELICLGIVLIFSLVQNINCKKNYQNWLFLEDVFKSLVLSFSFYISHVIAKILYKIFITS